MPRLRFLAGVGLACALLLAGCAPRPQDRPVQAPLETATAGAVAPPTGAYPTPGDAGTSAYPDPGALSSGYPEPGAVTPALDPSDPASVGRSQSALESYKLALEYAQQEFGEVAFYGIIPSHIMLRNLGNPPVNEGWFYKFKSPDDPAFHFVQVSNGTVLGARSLTPLGEDEPQQPIEVATITVDSAAVFDQFRQRAPELGITINDQLVYDLELVSLPGSPAPIWSVVTPEGSQWLFSVNAVTGEETPNPRP